MKEELRTYLDRFRAKLAVELESSSSLLNRLLSNGVIESVHLEKIKSKPTNTEKNEELIDILKLRDDDKFEGFVNILTETQPGLAKVLINPLSEWDSSTLVDQSSEECFGKRMSELDKLNLLQIANETKDVKDKLLLEKEILLLRSSNSELNQKFKDLEKSYFLSEESNQNLDNSLSEANLKNEEYEKLLTELKQEKIDLKKECQVLMMTLDEKEKFVTKLQREISFQTDKIAQLQKSCEEKRIVESKLAQLQDKYPQIPEEIVQKARNIQVHRGSEVMGIALLNRRIYMVCLKMSRIFVFKDESPYDQIFSEEFEVKSMKNPRDMVCCEKNKFLLIADICDGEEHKIWCLQNVPEERGKMKSSVSFDLSGTEKMCLRQVSVDESFNNPAQVSFKTSSWPINRKPEKLFAYTSEDKQLGTMLLILATSFDKSGMEYFVYIYQVSEKKLMKRILLGPDLGEILHVIAQPPLLKNTKSLNSSNLFESPMDEATNDFFLKMNLIVSHKSIEKTADGKTRSVWLVSKLSADGATKLSSFEPSVVDNIKINRPEYLALAENCRIVLADKENNRILILGPKLSGGQTLIKKDSSHVIEKPTRIVYNRLKRMIVVSHWDCMKGRFSVFTH